MSVILKQQLLLVSVVLSLVSTLIAAENEKPEFTARDVQYLKGFTLATLPRLRVANDNQYADNIEVAEFGRQLFFDTRLSANKKVACSSCHQPDKYFTDNLKLAVGQGETLSLIHI